MLCPSPGARGRHVVFRVHGYARTRLCRCDDRGSPQGWNQIKNEPMRVQAGGDRWRKNNGWAGSPVDGSIPRNDVRESTSNPLLVHSGYKHVLPFLAGRNCEQALWKSLWELHRHERTCEAGVNRIYKGGVYRPPSSVFERLDDEGITIADTLRYYPYRTTFDFECHFDRNNVPADTDHVQWVARHVPLSVSIASNVPGYEPAQCYITDGDSDKLVADMIDHLTAISDAAYKYLLPSYEYVLDELKARKEAWDEEEEEETNPYENLIQELCTWLHQLPAIGFN